MSKQDTPTITLLSKAETTAINAYWRAANFLSVGQIYLLKTPLLKEPLKAEHVKPSLLGHWGTTPGVNALIFTAGIGENDPEIRGSVCDGLQCLGCYLDSEKNESLDTDGQLSNSKAPVEILLIHSREDFEIAREVMQVLQESA